MSGPSTAPCKLARRQLRLDEIGEQRRQAELRDETDRAADHAGGDDEHQELQQVQAQHLAMASAEAFHQRDGVEPPRDEAPRGHRNGHAAEQHAHERGEHEKPLGVGHGRADFGPPVAEILDVVLRPQERHEVGAKRFDRSARAPA